jgi:hypothetical protein
MDVPVGKEPGDTNPVDAEEQNGSADRGDTPKGLIIVSTSSAMMLIVQWPRSVGTGEDYRRLRF